MKPQSHTSYGRLFVSAQQLWRSAWEHLRAFFQDLVDLRMLPIKLLFFMELAGE